MPRKYIKATKKYKPINVNATPESEPAPKLEQESLTALIVCFFISMNISFMAIENKYFRLILKHLAPWYNPPCRNTLTSRRDGIYLTALKLVAEGLKNKAISLTIDLATVLNSTRQFLVVSAHYLDRAKGELVFRTLGLRQMIMHSTHVDIMKELKDVLDAVGLRYDQIQSCTTDGGGNVILATEKMFGKVSHWNCVNHMMNLVVRDSLKSNKTISGHISLVNETVTFFKMSNVAMNIYNKLQDEKEGWKRLALLQAVRTRWNSDFVSIKRFLLVEHFVAATLKHPKLTSKSKKKPSPMSRTASNTLSAVVPLLEPFEEMTRFFSGDKYATSSSILCGLNGLHRDLSQMDIARGETEVVNLRCSLTKNLGVRAEPFKKNIRLALAQLLDPRIKSFELSDATMVKVKANLETEYLLEMVDFDDDEPPINRRKVDEESTFERENPLLAALRENDDEKNHGLEHLDGEEELNSYLQEAVQPLRCNPFHYWIDNGKKYPNLSKVALRYLSVPASSTASERIVSSLNFVLSKRRSRMLSINANKMVFLRGLEEEIWSQIIGIPI